MFFLFLLCCLWLSSCERDDICAESTPTTPLLVIDFFDQDNPSELKAPNNLLIIAQGSTEGLLLNSSSVSLPLRTDEDQTQYTFVLNFESEDPDNIENADSIFFNHVRQEEYISKACGFRITYQALQDEIIAGNDGSWVDNITIVNTTVEDETEAHIRIFH